MMKICKAARYIRNMLRKTKNKCACIIGVQGKKEKIRSEEPILEVIMAEIFSKLIMFSHRFKKLYGPQVEKIKAIYSCK